MTTSHWLEQRWQRPDGRFYYCLLQKNLFDEWVLIRRWGTIYDRRGRSMETLCQGYEDGVTQIATVAKRRQQRGYASTNPGS